MPFFSYFKSKFQCCAEEVGQRHEVNIGRPDLEHPVTNSLRTTKYNMMTFLPKFLFSKLTEPSNAFFLMLTFLQCFPISPFSWHSSGAPLISILVVNAFTELYEDLLREGDIVRIGREENVPADLLLLSSSEPGGVLYIETANLDGESNLKIRQAPMYTNDINSAEKLRAFIKSESLVICDRPSRSLDYFQGVLRLNHGLLRVHNQGSEISAFRKIASDISEVPLTLSNLVFRGAKVRQTDWMVGVVIYAGRNTKLALNSVRKSTKVSRLHKLANWLVVTQIGWLLVICAILTLWAQAQSKDWLREMLAEKADVSIFETFLGELILYANLVPISLYVTVEGCLMCQAYYLQQDILLYDEGKDQKAEVKSFGMIPNLGAIKYVMSDKTGTLTTNMMRFKFCSIGGQKYGKRVSGSDEFYTDKLLADLRTNRKENAGDIDLFMTACAVCHTVVVEREKRAEFVEEGETPLSRDATPMKSHRSQGSAESSARESPLRSTTVHKSSEPTYHACSPDEAAIVRFARAGKYCFTGRTPNAITVEVNGEPKIYTLLAVLEFSSTRKRMAVIVQTPEGTIRLFVKGADIKILSMLSSDSNQKTRHATQSHLKEFANLGYRTLCYGYRDLTEREYSGWSQLWQSANCDLNDRQAQMDQVAELIERDITLLGASAIEDKLQDRVPQTIARMLQADIRVWVLTGDKLETALNIGYSCSLVTPQTPTLILACNTEEETAAHLDKYVDRLGSRCLEHRDNQMALIVDAHCLDWVLGSRIMRMDFLRLALCCSAVICCRCTPLQKAAVTRLVRGNVDGLVLAIGDGANDVAMIQEADVGVGISGFEGGQASAAADFSLTQFRHLDRLLFVHGASCFHRITKIVLYTLYKNLVEVCMNVTYAFYNGHSDSGMADEYTMVRYNLFYTSITVGCFGVHDNPAPLHVMAKYPRLYPLFQNNISIRSHMMWSANAIAHAFLIFHSVLYWWKYGTSAFTHGRDGWTQMVGTFMYLCLVVIVNFKALIESRSISVISAIGFFGSLLAYLVLLLSDSYVFPHFSAPVLAPNRASYLGLIYSLPSPSTAFFIPLMCAVCLVPDIIVKSIERTMDPSLLQRVVQSLKTKDNVLDLILRQPLVKVVGAVGLKAQLEGGKLGYMFAQDDGRVITQADLLRMYGAADCHPEAKTPVAQTPQTIRSIEAKTGDAEDRDKKKAAPSNNTSSGSSEKSNAAAPKKNMGYPRRLPADFLTAEPIEDNAKQEEPNPPDPPPSAEMIFNHIQ
ncbi:unnamed protein product, partial [Mesorhabditis spiculigera]